MNRNTISSIQNHSNLLLNENQLLANSIDLNNQLTFNLGKSEPSEIISFYNNDPNIMDLNQICNLIGIYIYELKFSIKNKLYNI